MLIFSEERTNGAFLNLLGQQLKFLKTHLSYNKIFVDFSTNKIPIPQNLWQLQLKIFLEQATAADIEVAQISSEELFNQENQKVIFITENQRLFANSNEIRSTRSKNLFELIASLPTANTVEFISIYSKTEECLQARNYKITYPDINLEIICLEATETDCSKLFVKNFYNPELSFDFYLKGEELFEKKNYLKALDYFNKAILFNACPYYAYLSKANCYGELNKYEIVYKIFSSTIIERMVSSATINNINLFELLFSREKNNDFIAQWILGVCYEKGFGVQQCIKTALLYYHKAGEQNKYAPAQFKVGVFLIDKHVGRAIAFFNYAAEQQYDQAQQVIGAYLLEGKYCEKDEKGAFELFELAANQDNFMAQYALGTCYEEGNGVAKDEQRALEYYQISANQNCALAQYCMAMLYTYGDLGLEKNRQKGFLYCQLAASQGDPKAQNLLGLYYGIGIEIAKNYELAVEYYIKSAGQNDSSGLVNLGSCYQRGVGVVQDLIVAIECYEEAIEIDQNLLALINLAICYENGIGVNIDKELANKNYFTAKLKVLEIESFKLGAEFNDSESQFKLGICYEKGIGVPENKETALEYYQQAATQEHPLAIKYLSYLIPEEIENINPSKEIKEQEDKKRKGDKLQKGVIKKAKIELLNIENSSNTPQKSQIQILMSHSAILKPQGTQDIKMEVVNDENCPPSENRNLYNR